MQFYSLKKILKANAHYNLVIGERSNGKTFAALKYAVERYVKFGEQFAYIRRWKEDLTLKRKNQLFDGLERENVISKLTKSEYTTAKIKDGVFKLCRFEEELNAYVYDNNPIGFTFALNDMEHDKSTGYNGVTTIIYDEFLTRGIYIQDEFVVLSNVLSTIIRHRDNVKIFMLANTVNKYNPYFSEMGLTKASTMKQGTIDLYTYGHSNLRVAIEYCKPLGDSKESNVYFAFDNPKLNMIKNGAWEMANYPHLPKEAKYKPIDVAFIFFIDFQETLLQCEIVVLDTGAFIYVHQKTTDLQKPFNDVVYNLNDDNYLANYRYSFTRAIDKLDRTIISLFNQRKVFYQSNEVGEIVNNFLKQSGVIGYGKA